MYRFSADFIDELGFLGDNCIEIVFIVLVFALRTIAVTTKVSTNETDSAAKEGDEVVH